MIHRRLHAEQLLAFETEYRSAGTVAGIDEAGRGPLAGPVVAACVIMPPDPVIIWVDDSKKLSEKRRESVYSEILSCALYVKTGIIPPEEIDRINILQATKEAMRAAASDADADFFLIDAVKDLGLSGNEVPIIKGDALSYSIAAASIVAKVTRDRIMKDLDLIRPGYGFAKNKGYGTKEHIEALKLLGPCPEHRRTFIGNFV